MDDIVDEVAIDGLSASVRIGIAGTTGALRFFAVSGSRDVLAEPLFQQEVLGRLIACGSVPTRHGVIEFEAASVLPALPWSLAARDTGSSSNCVSRLLAGAVPLVHKVYRQLAPANVELDASMRLDQAAPGVLARCLGGYRYRSTNGEQLVLGLVTEYVRGEGVYAAMSRDLRALWSGDARQADPHLLEQLAGWRDFLGSFHDTIERTFGGGAAAPDFDLAAFCADARARLGRLRAHLHGDPLLGPQTSGRVARLFDQLESSCFAAGAANDLRASACHGDLHLSHLLVQAEGTQRRLIDFSPLALTKDEARFRASSKLLDWAALERALDYFFLDEAALALSQHTGQDQQLAMQGLIGASAPLVERAGQWRTQVRAALCGPERASAVRRRFYFARLLQELEYNYDHQRPYYRCIDFCSLIKQFLHLPKEGTRAYR
ncbi:phosphotransferase [Massilia sp. TSP1-1-2]|uniref:phosphotransferase n=1 Tax=Massilia sp. TSP1-1-2 TaxID=2804649 RepID=UPI003CF185E1